MGDRTTPMQAPRVVFNLAVLAVRMADEPNQFRRHEILGAIKRIALACGVDLAAVRKEAREP